MSTEANNKTKIVEWLTREEAAEYLSCSIATIDNYRRKGIIKFHQLVKGSMDYN